MFYALGIVAKTIYVHAVCLAPTCLGKRKQKWNKMPTGHYAADTLIPQQSINL